MNTNQPIPLSSPDVTAAEREAVLDVMSGSHLSLGPVLPAFEQEICQVTGSRHAIAVNSGTSGLHLCIKAAEVGEGDEVITSPFSFIASANCILFERGTPVFVDIDPVSFNIDIARISSAITPRTKAILPVHVFGRPVNMPSLMSIANRRGLTVIEDSCEAIGSTIAGRSAGTFGQTGNFAFYPNKQITTGEGGMIITDDDRVARLCRSWRNQGRGEGSAWLQHERLGYNYRLSDVNCALGLEQVRRLPEICGARRKVAGLYDYHLSQFDDIVLPRLEEPGMEISWFVYVIRLSNEYTREDRDEVLSYLKDHGIGCNNYFTPIHLQPFYREQFRFKRGQFPITEHVAARTIALPFFNHLSEEQVARVTSVLGNALTTVKRKARYFEPVAANF